MRNIKIRKHYRDMLHNGLSVALFGLLVFVFINFFAGCRNFGEEGMMPGKEVESVAVTVLDTWEGESGEDVPTRSSIADVSLVKSAAVAAYRLPEGRFESSASAANASGVAPGAMSLTLTKGCSYRIYTVANCGTAPLSWPARESGLASVRLSFTDAEVFFPGGAPMAGSQDVTFNDDMSITLRPKRMVSEWTVKFRDVDALGYQVTFARMRQAAKDVLPWAESKANSVFATGDRGAGADLSDLTGSGAKMYVLENARGVLSSLSTGHSARENDVRAADPDHYGLYTYLEIGLHFPDGTEYMRDPSKTSAEEDVIYRVYLRGSAYNDFSVLRNKRMTLTVSGTKARLDDDDPGLDWYIEDNTVPAGNIITGTVYPVDWEDGSDLVDDHFTPTIYNLIVQDSGEPNWRKYSTMESILSDETVMEEVCSSGKALWRLMSNLEITTDITAFEARVDELTTRGTDPLNLAEKMDIALSSAEGQQYFDKLAYSKTDARAYNTWYDFSTDEGPCWVEEENRAVTIFKGAMWYNNYYHMGSVSRGDPSWSSRRITARSMLNGIVFVNATSPSSTSPATRNESPYRVSLCSIFLSNEGTKNDNGTSDKSDDTYPTYVYLNTYLLKSEYRVPFGMLYAKAYWTDRSNAGCNLVANTADMTSDSFRWMKKKNTTPQTFQSYEPMATTAFSGIKEGFSPDVPTLPSGYVGNPLTKSYVFHPEYSQNGDVVPEFVLTDNIIPHDKHVIVSCYVKSTSGSGYSSADVRLCLRDAENVLKEGELVESVGIIDNSTHRPVIHDFYAPEDAVAMNSSIMFYCNRNPVLTNGTWKRITTAFTLTDSGAERPLQIGLYANRFYDTYVDDDGKHDYSCNLYVAAFMVEPGIVDHGYVPFWNEGRGFSVAVTDVYTDKAEAARNHCTWYAVTHDSPVDIEGDSLTLPYKHNWTWQEWKPMGHSFAE